MNENNKPTFNLAKKSLAEDKPITLLMVTMPSVAHVQIWAQAGIDVLCFDMEHGVIDINSLHQMIAATKGTGVTPIVRIPWNMHWLVKPVLDAGALGIMFPLVEDGAQAKEAVASMYYPPKGNRGWGPFMTQYRWGMPQSEYVKLANDNVMTFIQIERPEAIENLDEIMAVDDIDMFVISRHDLTMAMGHVASPTAPLHPEVQQAVSSLEKRLHAANAPVASLAPNRERAAELIEQGCKCLILGFDWMLIERSAAVNSEIQSLYL